MEVNNKRKITLTIIGVATLLMLVLSATFAYFSASTSNDKGTTNVTASTEKVGSIALSNPTGDLHLNLSVSDMAQDNLNTYWATDNESKNYDSEEVPREIAVAELSGGSATAKYECTTTISVELSDTMASKLQPGDGYIQFGELLTDKIDLTSISADGYQVTFKLDGTNVKRQRVTAAIALVNRNNDQSYIAGEKLGITFTNSDLECQVVSKPTLSETIIALSNVEGSGVYNETVSGNYNAIIPASEEAWNSVNTTKNMYCGVECSEGLLSQLKDLSIFWPTGESGVWNFAAGWYMDEEDLEGKTYGELTLVPKENGYYTVKVIHSDYYSVVISVNNEVIYDGGWGGIIELGYLTSSDEINISIGQEEDFGGDNGYFIFYREESASADAGYRYKGKEVNNYVTFNDETWRIIGVEEGSTIGLETGKYYTKIIKKDSFDSQGYFDELELISNILNDGYYNKAYPIGFEDLSNYDYTSTGLSEESRGLLVKPTWYEIAYSEVSTTSYLTEKINGRAYSRYVGLMSPSDYHLSALQSDNWLYNGTEWVLSEIESEPESQDELAIAIDSVGNLSVGTRYNHIAYRPVVYLNSDVIITNNGDGSINNKYEISLNS